MSTHHPTMNPRAFPGPMAAAPWPPGYHGTGYYHHRPHYPGFCHTCCHPLSACVCGFRECRREAKELLVRPGDQLTREELAREIEAGGGEVRISNLSWASHYVAGPMAEAVETTEPGGRLEAEPEVHEARPELGFGQAFIGGGCCVHLSIEYTASTGRTGVEVRVEDSENTILTWAKIGEEQGYYIKESIITTNPGATLRVTVRGVTARVRWCEVFSC